MMQLFLCLFIVSVVLFWLWRDAVAKAAYWQEEAVRWQERLYDCWREQENAWNEILRNSISADLSDADEANWWKYPQGETDNE